MVYNNTEPTNISIMLTACTLDNAYDRVIAAVLRIASLDYIKAKRKFNKNLLTEEEMEQERKIYARCVENWTPFSFDVINPEYMLSECDRIADSNQKIQYI